VVQYEGRAEHTRGYSDWATLETFKAYLDRPGKKYLIFGAPWCVPCTKLKGLMAEEKLDHEVLYLNIDQTWAFLVSRKLGTQDLPTMVVIDDPNPPKVILGMNKIIMHALIHINPQR
jgi:thiol-disulfide isomerase/thioredoxin